MKNGLTKNVLRNYLNNSLNNRKIINKKIEEPGSSRLIFNRVYKEKFNENQLVNKNNEITWIIKKF